MYDRDISNGLSIRCVQLYSLPGTASAQAIEAFRRTTELRDRLQRWFGSLIP